MSSGGAPQGNFLSRYFSETPKRDLLVDQLHLITLGCFLAIVLVDWAYWKTSPYPLHTMIVYGIIFTFLTLRLSSQRDLSDFSGLLQQLNFLPRALTAFLAGANSVVLAISLARCRAVFPDFLRLPYLILTLIIIALGFL